MKKLSASVASAVTVCVTFLFLAMPLLVPVAVQPVFAQTVPTCPAGYICTPIIPTSVTAAISLDPSSPFTGTVPVTNTTQGQYLGLPVLVFDVQAQGGPLTLNGLDASFTTSGSGSLSAAYLYQGSTLIASAAISNVPGAVANFGKFSSISIPAGSSLPLMIKVDVSNVSGPGFTVSSNINPIAVSLVNQNGASVIPSGSVQGNVITVVGTGPAVSLAGTPTITDTIITPSGTATTTFMYTATFNVNVAAVGESVTLGLPSDTNPAFGNASTPATIAETYINSVASPISGMVASYSQPSGTTLGSNGTSFVIGQNQTVTIPVTYSFIVHNPGANQYGVRLLNMNYSSAGGKGSVPVPNACTPGATCSSPTSSGPSVTVNGMPTLALTYNSAKQESALTASFNFSVSGGSQGINILANAPVINFLDQNGNTADINLSGVSLEPTSSVVGTTQDNYGQLMYVVPAGQSVSFTATATINPQQLFAGTYHATLFDLGANASTNINNEFELQVPANQTNVKTIVGEIAPYITSVSPNPATVGQTMTITGQRFSGGPGALVYIDNQEISSGVTGNNTTLTFILPSLSNGSHILQIKNITTGASNIVSFQVTGGQPTITGITAPASSGSQVYAGEKFNIEGTNFSTPDTVYVGNQLATIVQDEVFESNGKELISAMAPSNLQSGSSYVYVTNSNGTSNRFPVTTFAETNPTSNLPPVISGLTAPTSLTVGQTGTWIIQASDPQSGSLSYSVNWGDSSTPGPQKLPLQTTNFTHSYANAGTYTVSFTVTDSAGLTAQTSTTVTVSNSTPVTPPVAPPVTAPPVPASVITAINHSQNPATAQGLIYVYWTAAPANSGGAYTYTVTANPSFPGGNETTPKTGVNMGCYAGGCFNGGGPFPTNGPYTFTVTATNGNGTVTLGTSNSELVSPATPTTSATPSVTTSPNSSSVSNAWETFVNFLRQL